MRRPALLTRKRVALPIKPLVCFLCSFTSTLGQNNLQLHLDVTHHGWAEDMIKKMRIQITEA
ncbi:MAG: hypothetical protein JWO13_2609 [Acidobacteriales bacterium]|nr:hypothetical protein [Terriglobales bacterium]